VVVGGMIEDGGTAPSSMFGAAGTTTSIGGDDVRHAAIAAVSSTEIVRIGGARADEPPLARVVVDDFDALSTEAGPSLTFARSQALAVHLGERRVAVIGGEDVDDAPVRTVEIVDLDARTVTVGPTLAGDYRRLAELGASAFVLDDGRIFVGFSIDEDQIVELVDVETGSVERVELPRALGGLPSAAPLPDGRVLMWPGVVAAPETGDLVVGGAPLVFAPIAATDDARWSDGPVALRARSSAAIAVLDDGTLVVAGGGASAHTVEIAVAVTD